MKGNYANPHINSISEYNHNKESVLYFICIFLFSLIKLTTICFYLETLVLYSFVANIYFYLHIVNGRVQIMCFFLVSLYRILFPKKTALKFKSKLLYSLIFIYFVKLFC